MLFEDIRTKANVEISIGGELNMDSLKLNGAKNKNFKMILKRHSLSSLE